MPTRLNSITLPDNITNRMKVLLKETKNNRLEYGFDICGKNNNLIMRNECHGTLCSIELPRGCNTDEKLVGDYHTHPRGTSLLSNSDMHIACRLNFSCIGSSHKKQDRILCHIRKSDVNITDCREDSFSRTPDNNISDKYFRQIDIF
jgi:hypothetical protein